MTFDVSVVRKQFPILERKIGDRPLVYLDSAATTQKPSMVIDAMVDYYERYNANVHRGLHTLAEEATVAYEDARSKVARFGNADPRGVVFTKSTTESINLIAYSFGRRRLGPDDEIVLTVMEHHSNLVPWLLVARDTGCKIRYIDVTDDGYLDYEALERTITERTKLVSVSGMSNVLGTVNDVSKIAAVAHARGALVVVDAAQLAPHRGFDFATLGADVVAFSSHKMCGPTGVGVLIAAPEFLEDLDPFMGGGEMIRDVSLDDVTFNEVPWKFEAGTPPIAEAIGLGYAIDFLSSLGIQEVRDYEHELSVHALGALSAEKGVKLYGPLNPNDRGAVFSFNLFDDSGELIHPHDSGTFLDSRGIAVRAGHHCARPLMKRFDLPATLRASCYVYTTTEEIDVLVESIAETRKFFAR